MSEWVDFVQEQRQFGPEYDPQKLSVHAYNVDGGTFCDIYMQSMGGSSFAQLTIDEVIWLRDVLARTISINAGELPVPWPPLRGGSPVDKPRPGDRPPERRFA